MALPCLVGFLLVFFFPPCVFFTESSFKMSRRRNSELSWLCNTADVCLSPSHKADDCCLSVNTYSWLCFCSQHALPVHSAHGNVSLQKRHCNKVFQDPEWPLQGRACVLLSCQLDGCSSYWCWLNSPYLTRVLFLTAEFFQSNTSTFSMCCKVRFKNMYVVICL